MPLEKGLTHYEIRGIETRAEVLKVADLFGKAFGNYPRLYPNYLDLLLKRMPREQWRLSRTMWAPDGTPIAHVRIADRTMRLGAAMLRVAGIGDVATHPSHRKRGLMRTLFAHLNHFMHDEPYDLSLLFGIPNFYDKFGYIVALSTDHFIVSRQQLARLEPPYRGRRANRGDVETIRLLHRDDLATRDGAMARWGEIWLRGAVREKWCRLIEDPRGRPRAYWRGNPRDDDSFALTEVSLGPKPDEPAVVSVLADLVKCARACEKPKLRIELPAAHPIGQFCIADGCEAHRWIGHRGGSMVRITNLETLCHHMAPEWERLLAASPAASWAGRLRLKTDPSTSLRAGLGTVDLAIARGKVRPEPPKGRAGAVIAAAQDKLCRLVVGFHTPAASAAVGEARITTPASPLAAALFPVRSLAFFPYDRF
jgi:predicted N-acetyltransferase YhbS